MRHCRQLPVAPQVFRIRAEIFQASSNEAVLDSTPPPHPVSEPGSQSTRASGERRALLSAAFLACASGADRPRGTGKLGSAKPRASGDNVKMISRYPVAEDWQGAAVGYS